VQFLKDRRLLLKQGLAFAVTTLAGCGGEPDNPITLAGSPIAPPVAGPSPGSSPAPTTPSTSTPPTSSINPPTSATPVAAWVPAVPTLIVGSSATFELSQTLPSGVVRGGTFGIDPAGIPLPTGMKLQSGGTLSVGSATVGTVTGVVFTYDEP
jgi:hypothetical protein